MAQGVPHIVAEDATFALLVEAPQPKDALDLVGVQLVVQTLVEMEAVADVRHADVVVVARVVKLVKVSLIGTHAYSAHQESTGSSLSHRHHDMQMIHNNAHDFWSDRV